MAKATESPSMNVEQAAAAIVELVNARPATPSAGEIAAILQKMTWAASSDCPDVREVRRLSALLAECEQVAGDLKGAAFDAAEAERARCRAELDELEARIPNP